MPTPYRSDPTPNTTPITKPAPKPKPQHSSAWAWKTLLGIVGAMIGINILVVIGDFGVKLGIFPAPPPPTAEELSNQRERVCGAASAKVREAETVHQGVGNTASGDELRQAIAEKHSACKGFDS
jgi:hypothetical protein